MRRPKVTAALVAALLLLLTTLTAQVLLASPSQALGWSGRRCNWSNGSNWRVCTEVYVTTSGGGYLVQKIELCASKEQTLYYNGFRGTYHSDIQFTGSGGSTLAYTYLPDVAPGVGYLNCVQKAVSFQMGGGAYYAATGSVDLAGVGDERWFTCGYILGAGC